MKKLVFSILLFGAVITTSFAQTTKADIPVATTKNANLSDEEREKIRAIKAQGAAEKKAIESDKTLTPEQRAKKLKDLKKTQEKRKVEAVGKEKAADIQSNRKDYYKKKKKSDKPKAKSDK
jgi:biopolymer transport protein ExbD